MDNVEHLRQRAIAAQNRALMYWGTRWQSQLAYEARLASRAYRKARRVARRARKA